MMTLEGRAEEALRVVMGRSASLCGIQDTKVLTSVLKAAGSDNWVLMNHVSVQIFPSYQYYKNSPSIELKQSFLHLRKIHGNPGRTIKMGQTLQQRMVVVRPTEKIKKILKGNPFMEIYRFEEIRLSLGLVS